MSKDHAFHHGATLLPSVEVRDYNSELRDGEGFLGDRASNGAFRAILEDIREPLRKLGQDPFGDTDSDELRKKALDKALLKGEPEAAGVVHAAVEAYANELATVTGRFLRTKAWRDVERIVIGGGLRGSRVGELAIGRAAVILKSTGRNVDLVPVLHDPDHAGLLGALHLAPAWIFTGFDAILAVDIGGSNMRVGIVETHADNAKTPADLADAQVTKTELWRHCEEKPKRDEAVDRLVEMLEKLVASAARDGKKLAPFIGIGCPGVIEESGAITTGGQNLPGNWESSRFNLPKIIAERIPEIDGHETHVVLHNDAVVQGLSQAPWMGDTECWGVFTIGTGLGNACFANRRAKPSEKVAASA